MVVSDYRGLLRDSDSVYLGADDMQTELRTTRM
jgi:hypothetical protein